MFVVRKAVFEVRIDMCEMSRTDVRKCHILATGIIRVPLRGNIFCECSQEGQSLPPMSGSSSGIMWQV